MITILYKVNATDWSVKCFEDPLYAAAFAASLWFDGIEYKVSEW